LKRSSERRKKDSLEKGSLWVSEKKERAEFEVVTLVGLRIDSRGTERSSSLS